MKDQQKILFIGYEEQRRALTLALRNTEFQVIQGTDLAETPKVVLNVPLHLVIVSEEVWLVDDRGLLSVLKRLTDAPIMVVGSGDRETQVRVLEQGSDSYLCLDAVPSA